VRFAGMVILRQRSETASGVTFMLMEDEHDLVNVIVWRHVAETYRRVLVESNLLAIDGEWQVADGSCHLIAHRLADLSQSWNTVGMRSRDYHLERGYLKLRHVQSLVDKVIRVDTDA